MSDSSTFGIKTFGTYSDKIAEMAGKYNQKPTINPKKNLQNEYVFFNANGSIAGNAYKEEIRQDGYNQPTIADAVVFDGEYMFGTSAKDESGLDKFDYIIKGEKQYAIDLNGNNIVEDEEIFDGKFDRDAYKKAKNSGNLYNYEKYHQEYTYDWLK